MRSTYRDKLLKSSCSCTLTFCQHLKNDKSHVIIQSLEHNFYITSNHHGWLLDFLDLFDFNATYFQISIDQNVCFVFLRYTSQGYENEGRTENYNWINIINRRTLLTCNTKENGKLLIFFEVLFRRSTINWRYQNKV